MEYSFVEYADMYLILGECHGNLYAAANLYAERYPNRRHPNANVIRRLDQRMRETGRTAPTPTANRGRPRRVSPQVEENILHVVENEPEQSTRSIARMFDISQRSVHRLLQQNGLHPYHYQRVQGLLPQDYQQRVRFCRWLLREQERNPGFIGRVLWTDESTFTRNGTFNIHNMHQWSDENPHALYQTNHQIRFSVNVWGGIIGNRLIGPHILPNRLNANNFVEFLETDFKDLLDDVPLDLRRNMFFQMDGAPAHWGIQTREWLNQEFPERWIGRGSVVIPWPPRSPDLNCLDFFLWGTLKAFVYEVEIDTQEQLQQRINEAVIMIQQNNMLENLEQNIIRRCMKCIEVGGSHFEHLL